MSLDEGRQLGIDLEGLEGRGGESGCGEGDLQMSMRDEESEC